MISRASKSAFSPGRNVVDVQNLAPALLVRIGIAALRRTNPHIVALDVGMQNAAVRHRPVFQVTLDPVGMLFQETAPVPVNSWARAISAAQMSAAITAARVEGE